jgi:hypothetical protein
VVFHFERRRDSAPALFPTLLSRLRDGCVVAARLDVPAHRIVHHLVVAFASGFLGPSLCHRRSKVRASATKSLFNPQMHKQYATLIRYFTKTIFLVSTRLPAVNR